MNNRFVIFLAISILGHCFSKELTYEDKLQALFVAQSALLKNSWDVNESNITSLCMLYDDLILFDLSPLAGPFYAEVKVEGTIKKMEVRFCAPASMSEDTNKSALAFFIDDTNKRVTRLTSGSETMNSINTLRTWSDDGDSTVDGVFYTAMPING